MPLVLAIEPDPRQAATLKRVVKVQVRAELIVVDSKDAALATIATRIPDLILVTALLPPRDEDDLTRHLKTLDRATHLQTVTIPLLASAPAPEKPGNRMFGPLRRKRRPASIDGCDPRVFGEQIEAYLQRAAELRAEKRAHPVVKQKRPLVSTPAGSDGRAKPAEQDSSRGRAVEIATQHVAPIAREPVVEQAFGPAGANEILEPDAAAARLQEVAEQAAPVIAREPVVEEAFGPAGASAIAQQDFIPERVEQVVEQADEFAEYDLTAAVAALAGEDSSAATSAELREDAVEADATGRHLEVIAQQTLEPIAGQNIEAVVERASSPADASAIAQQDFIPERVEQVVEQPDRFAEYDLTAAVAALAGEDSSAATSAELREEAVEADATGQHLEVIAQQTLEPIAERNIEAVVERDFRLEAVLTELAAERDFSRAAAAPPIAGQAEETSEREAPERALEEIADLLVLKPSEPEVQPAIDEPLKAAACEEISMPHAASASVLPPDSATGLGIPGAAAAPGASPKTGGPAVAPAPETGGPTVAPAPETGGPTVAAELKPGGPTVAEADEDARAEKKASRRRRRRARRPVPELETPTAGLVGRWVADALAALRVDIERLRRETLAAGTSRASAARERETLAAATSTTSAAGEASRARAGSGPSGASGSGSRPSHTPQPDTQEPQPVQDEWGFYDPGRCGMQALMARLDAQGAADQDQAAGRSKASAMQELIASHVDASRPRLATAPTETSDDTRLTPLAMWAHADEGTGHSIEQVLAGESLARLPDLMAGLRLPDHVAAVRYASGCRIRRIRVAPGPEKPRGDKRQVVILSKKALRELR